MLDDICAYLRNWFSCAEDQYVGDFVIRDGKLPLAFIDGVPYSAHANDGTITNDGYVFSSKLNDAPYIRIIGSRFNDGVYKYAVGGVTGLTDEEFHGAVWVLSIPPALVALDTEITNWCTANADAINSPYQSESFGGYSYSKGYSGGSAQGASWINQFGARLARWRKI
jgi:hypothetical protein